MSLKIYKKKLEYTYAFGIFPTIEMLEKIPERVETVILSGDTSGSEGVNRIKELCQRHRINYDYGDKAIQKIAAKENTHAIGVFKKFYKPLEEDADHVVLVNPSDMGNVGTIIRTMVGFGVTNLVFIRPAIDVFDPRVVRSSMGALFDLRFQYFDSYALYEQEFPKQVKYPFVLDGKHVLGTFDFQEPAALIFGNEGQGLDSSFENMKHTVVINHTDKIDSFNLAISTALGLYELAK